MKACTTLFPKKHVSQDERRNYQQKKTNSKSKKNMTVKDKGLSLFLFD